MTGPAAATEATAQGLLRAEGAAVVVLVEGVSDQIAVETLTRRRGRDLAGDGAVVLPCGGATGIVRCLRRLGSGVRLVGCVTRVRPIELDRAPRPLAALLAAV